MEVETAKILGLQPLFGTLQSVLLFQFIENLIKSQKFGVWFVHLRRKGANVFCTDIGVAVDTGVCDSLLVHKIINEVGVVELFVRKTVQSCQGHAILTDQILKVIGKVFVQFDVDTKIHNYLPFTN